MAIKLAFGMKSLLRPIKLAFLLLYGEERAFEHGDYGCPISARKSIHSNNSPSHFHHVWPTHVHHISDLRYHLSVIFNGFGRQNCHFHLRLNIHPSFIWLVLGNYYQQILDSTSCICINMTFLSSENILLIPCCAVMIMMIVVCCIRTQQAERSMKINSLPLDKLNYTFISSWSCL